MTLRPSPDQRFDIPRMKEAPFGRVMTAMITPFDSEDNDAIDFEMTTQLARHLVANGSDGLVIAGTTGESPTLSHEEQRDLFCVARDAVDVPILAGTGSNNTREAVSLTEFVTDRSLADGLLQVVPYYNKPSQKGIERHFSMIADSTDLPIVLYDIPGRTGRQIDAETIIALAQRHSNIRGLKAAAGKPEETAALMNHPDLPENFVVYSGDDALNLELAQHGSVGAISVASHWAGVEIGAMYDAFDGGDDARARELNAILAQSYEFETSIETPNPHPAKAMLRAMGMRGVGVCRPPMYVGPEMEQSLEQRAMIVRQELDILYSATS